MTTGHISAAVEQLQPYLVKRVDNDGLQRALATIIFQAEARGADANRLLEENRQQEQQWQNQWENRVDVRLGAFIGLIGERVPMPALMRAAELAPAADVYPRKVEAPEWARQVGRALRDTEPEKAAELAQRVTARPSSSSGGGRRTSDGDLLVGFVMGALFL